MVYLCSVVQERTITSGLKIDTDKDNEIQNK